MALEAHEEAILEEIIAWETKPRERGFISNAGRLVSRPLDWAMKTKLSESVLERFSESIYTTLTQLHKTAGRTDSPEWVLERLRGAEIEVESLDELKDADIREIDKVAQAVFNNHTLAATLEGGGLGLGGLYLMAADIPALLMLNFRMIQRLAMMYGFDPKPEYEVDIALKIIQIANETDQDRRSSLVELDTAIEAMRAGTTKLGLFAGVLALQTFSQHLGKVLAKRKLGQLVPLVGVGIGAGVNYQFTRDIGETAYMVYRKRFLTAKQNRTQRTL